MKYFISHSYKDRSWARELVSIIQKIDTEISSEKEIFFSSTPETGSDIKESLLSNIDQNMNKCEIIILIVTENYLRSHYCYYELNIASYLKRMGKKVVLLVQHDEIYQRIKSIFPDDLYISANSDSAGMTLIHNLAPGDMSEMVCLEVRKFFDCMGIAEPPIGTAFLGMSKDDYENAFSFVERYHLERMTFGYPSTPDIVSERLSGAKEIIFVSTTGSGFIKTYRKLLTEAIASGVNISTVIADSNSPFSCDVGEFEVFDNNEETCLSDKNCKRIAAEFDSTIQYLNEIYKEAKRQAFSEIGSLNCYCGYTLIRQTVFIIRYEDSSVWGWITCTMPPERSADKTPSIVIKGSLEVDPFAQVVWKYCKTLTEFAGKRGGQVSIDGNTVLNAFAEAVPVEKNADIKTTFNTAKEYWAEKYETAKANMEDRKLIYDSVLIEVAAQHPLFRKREPNAEFRERLNKAIELYHMFTEQGKNVSIYVPGSRHKHRGIADDISLSQAGCTYLSDCGIPKSALLGDDINVKYKGDDGVYNSADECYAASGVFFDGDYAELICVCSPNQVMRKTMFYLEFGCLPVCYGITTPNMHHANIVNEIFDSLNTVLYFDHSWQDKDAELYRFFRNERKP